LPVMAKPSRLMLFALCLATRTEEGDKNLMPHIRLILQDDQGNPIPGAEERIYQLQGECQTLDQIEQTKEKFKREALPEIEHSLLQRAQQRFVVSDRGEKQDLRLPRLNGKERVRIETIHASFEFAEQRFLLPDGSGCRYLKRTGHGLRSSGIEEFFVCTTATASVSPK
jgi:hypothetical protein